MTRRILISWQYWSRLQLIIQMIKIYYVMQMSKSRILALIKLFRKFWFKIYKSYLKNNLKHLKQKQLNMRVKFFKHKNQSSLINLFVILQIKQVNLIQLKLLAMKKYLLTPYKSNLRQKLYKVHKNIKKWQTCRLT